VGRDTDDLIDQIEWMRKHNNINWCNLLRLAMKAAPAETKALLREINADDKKISLMLTELSR
jgi:hypothetical protein